MWLACRVKPQAPVAMVYFDACPDKTLIVNSKTTESMIDFLGTVSFLKSDARGSLGGGHQQLVR
jgi:hypothetical protein